MRLTFIALKAVRMATSMRGRHSAWEERDAPLCFLSGVDIQWPLFP